MNLNELMARRAALVTEAREILDIAEKDSARDLTAEETTKYDAIMADADKIGAQVTRERKLREREKEIVESRVVEPKKDEEVSPEEKQLRSFFNGEIRELEIDFKASEVRDLTKGTATEGGNTVPVSFVRSLYQHLIENAAIRQANPTVITTTSGEDLRVPKTTTHPSAALFAEGVAITESNAAFGLVTLQAFKYGHLIQVTRELISDTAVDLLGYVAKIAGQALGNASGADMMVGDGSAKPLGLVAAATVGVTATGTNVVTTDEIIDLYHSVIAPYRNRATWFMKDATVAHIRKKKDSDGQYIWQPGLQLGQPDLLLGRPIITDPNIDALATGKKVIAFGDASTYYIRDVGSVRFERSDEFAFNADLVTFKSVIRTDGDLVDTSGAVKYIITA